jgi:hypothetical protein
MWRMCINQELMNLCREPDIISEIGKRRLRLLGHVEGMPEEIILKKVFKNTQEGERSVRKPRKRWLDDAEIDLKKIGVRGWGKITKGRDAWKLFLKQARVLHGPQGQGRERERAGC